LLLCLLPTAYCLVPTSLFAQNKTTVTGSLLGPDGSPANGFISVTATVPFTSADGYNVTSGPPIQIAITNGSFTAALIPNAGSSTSTCSSPNICDYYQVTFNLSSTLGNAFYSQTWEVPAAGPVAYQTIVVTSPPSVSYQFPFTQLTPPAGCLTDQFPEWTGSAWTCAAGGSGGGGTPGGSNGQIQYDNGGAFGGFTLAGDCTFSLPNITCTKTNGTALGSLATSSAALAQTVGAVSHKWLNSYNSATGAFTETQPASTDLSDISTLNAPTATALAGTPTICSSGYAPTGILSNGNATGCTQIIGGGGMTWPSATGVAVYSGSSSWSSSLGVGTAANNLVQLNSNAYLPALNGSLLTNLTYANLVGAPTLAATMASASHKWLNSYTATTGAFTQTQPASSDLSDYGSLTGALFGSQTANCFFAAPNGSNGNMSCRAIVSADLPTTSVTEDFIVGFGSDDAPPLTTAQIYPQGALATADAAMTVNLILVRANTGASTVQIGYRHSGSNTAYTSAVITPAVVSGISDTVACANAAGTSVLIDGVSVTCGMLATQTWNAGDSILTVAGVADGVTDRLSVEVQASRSIVSGGGGGGGSMTWPSGTGVAVYSGSSSWSTSLSTSGSGSALCLIVSCVMTTPNLGTPSAVNLANATFPSSISSNAATATALASTPTQCSGNNFATGVAASGNANCAQPAFSNLSGSATNAQLPSSLTASTSGNAATATALASTPTLCSTGYAPTGILASGNATGCASLSSSGMSNPMTTLGDMIYENSTPAAARLAGSTSATKNFLTQTGTGSASAAPVWGTIAAGDLPNIGIAGGGTGQTTALAAFNALSPLTTEGDLAYYHSSANARLAIGSSGNCLTSNGTDPVWGSCGGSGATFQVNGSNTTSQTTINFVNGTYLTASNPSVGQVKFDITSLPNPAASTLGGIESLAAVSHKWINTISTSGVPSATQPASTDLSDYGSFPGAAFGSQTANTFYAAPNGSAGNPSFRAIVAADIPTLNQATTANAGTATALASTPSQCGSNNFATGVAASGNANCSQPAIGNLASVAASTVLGNNTTSSAAPTAFTLATDLGSITWNSGGTCTFAAAGAVIAAAKLSTTASQTCTLSPTNLVKWGSYLLEITNASGTAATLTLGTSGTCSAWKVGAGAGFGFTGSTITLAGASATDLLTFTYDGTNCVATFQ
jgi:hypothetical protein